MPGFVFGEREMRSHLRVEKFAMQCGSWVRSMGTREEDARKAGLRPNRHLLKQNLFPGDWYVCQSLRSTSLEHLQIV